MTGAGGNPLEAHGRVVLRTERLEMRPLSRAYLPHMLALYEDPRVTEFLVPLDEAGHLRRLAEAEQMWASRGFGRVAIHARDGGRFLGRGGLHYWAQFDEVEVGWALRTEAWGRGFATEAARAWLEWGLTNLDVPYLTACIAPDNMASRSVAARLGMSVLRADIFHGREVLVHALHRAQTDVSPGDGDELPGGERR
ncbi:GNAT family N-acetyltransferase [Blastococcus capsensis]|uniref:GNAT family N-acetyltransferase n=1 Tax=Blastococcus capsensis TaxID=1564163 RepID=UPI002541B427|nr:GNAT family N-acetyltransferase [Blastococcus capsensis]MDK3255444.1 GNAT family N-acetyltransferase [Blastococcus capsensis]